jgi:long-subunit fatty acid transport protein
VRNESVGRGLRRSTPLALLCLLLTASPARAQSTDDINSALQFNFSNPGARSLALAGAFTARADDATAVFANPAGLIQLSQPELSVDIRNWNISNPFLKGGVGRGGGELQRLEFGETSDSLEGLSFLSAFYPLRSGRWVAGVFRHESANFRTEVHSDGILFNPADIGRCRNSAKIRPLDGFYDLKIDSFGLSAAGRLGAGFSLGATVALSRFDLASRAERMDKLREEIGCTPPGPLASDSVPCCSFGNGPEDVITFQTQRTDPGRNEDIGLTAGVMWQSPRTVAGVPFLSIGAVYRRGPSFGFIGDTFFRRGGGPPYTYRTQRIGPDFPAECKVEDREGCSGTFKVPDVIGLGVSIRPSIRWVVAFDYNRVEYSDLSDNTLDIVNADPALGFGRTGTPQDFKIDDGDELRLGLEYALLRERSLPDIYFRGGAWLESEHRLRYEGNNLERQAIWRRGEDQLHYAAGIGLRFRGFQLDVGLDLSDTSDTLSLSSVYYFGR